MNRFDTPIGYGSGKIYTNENDTRVVGRIEGDLHFRAFNPGDSLWGLVGYIAVFLLHAVRLGLDLMIQILKRRN